MCALVHHDHWDETASGLLAGAEPAINGSGHEHGQPVLVSALGELLVDLTLDVLALARVLLEHLDEHLALGRHQVGSSSSEPLARGPLGIDLPEDLLWDDDWLLAS